MKAIAYLIVAALVAFSIIAPFWAHHHIQSKLMELQVAIDRGTQEISRLSDSNKLAAAQSAPRLSNDELKELLRLRAEIGRLHDTVAETEKLRASSRPGERAVSTPARAPSGPDYWPKDQLSYAGSATPEAVLKTAFWAMKNGDAQAMLSCIVPEMRAAAEFEAQKEGRSSADLENQFKQMAVTMTAGTTAFRVVDKRPGPDGDLTVQVSFEGEGVVQDFVLRTIGHEWKIAEWGHPVFPHQ